MNPTPSISLDALIIGGGVAGLWTLDELVRRGVYAALVERDALGTGQSVAAQGILHGGLKYTLDGVLTDSARSIRDLPALWNECLAGEAAPDLSAVEVRQRFCYLWRTSTLASRLGLVGARVGLKASPSKVTTDNRPEALKGVPGDVLALPETVVDPATVLAALAALHDGRIVRAHASAETLERVTLEAGDRRADVTPRWIILTAGAGNAALRKMLGLDPGAMQRRPLHMVMARGKSLPLLQGHCVDGRKTRATITADAGPDGQVVWQVGGQIAEDGVAMSRDQLLARARDELRAVLPGMSWEGVELATYRVDRAEAATPDRSRPAGVVCTAEGAVITGWPTKLVAAPQLAQEIAAIVTASDRDQDAPTGPPFPDWPAPSVAPPPWADDDVAWSAF